MVLANFPPLASHFKGMANSKRQDKPWLRRHWSDVLVGIFIVLMLVPATRTPLMIFVQRTFAFGPSTAGTDEEISEYNWAMQNQDGSPINFTEAQHEVVFVNFWATWCPPCIAEMPYMQNLYDDYGDKVKFYFVTDEDPEHIRQFMSDNAYTIPVTINRTNPPEPFEYKALPTTYIIGKDGSIQVKKKGSARWDSKKIRRLLDELLAE